MAEAVVVRAEHDSVHVYYEEPNERRSKEYYGDSPGYSQSVGAWTTLAAIVRSCSLTIYPSHRSFYYTIVYIRRMRVAFPRQFFGYFVQCVLYLMGSDR